MKFRGRLLLAFVVAVILPVAVFALGIRRQVAFELAHQYEERVDALVQIVHEDLERVDRRVSQRLVSLGAALAEDNRFRLGIQGAEEQRAYVLDYAERALSLTDLSMLQIQDPEGRIVSSGHFRNEFGRLDPELPRLLSGGVGPTVARVRSPEGGFLALARVDSCRVGRTWLKLVGGVTVDAGFTERLSRGDLTVLLALPAEAVDSGPLGSGVVGESITERIPLPFISPGPDGVPRADTAYIVVRHSLSGLATVRRSLDLWLLVAILVATALGLLLAMWLSFRVSRPLTELARKTSRIDLDRLDVEFSSDRRDEVGTLARFLGEMTERLRAGAAKLREAERRLAVGELARQVNHDLKNGLIPIRNVLRHLAQVNRERPEDLSFVFGERKGTLDSSLEYLGDLAANYARLSPARAFEACDLAAIATEVVRGEGSASNVKTEVRLEPDLPQVSADPVALRRILENVVRNAVESLRGGRGTVTVAAEPLDGGSARWVRITIRDDGCGMAEEQLERASDDFFTTKQGGTGLGLSIVRRLVMDLHGRMSLESRPGQGTTVRVDLPAWHPDEKPGPLAGQPSGAG
jgi:signal transduction histidine kinase